VSEPPRDAQALAEAVVRKMIATDALSRWLGLEVLEIAPRRSTCRMTVREEMVNGFGTSHGGIVFSLADSAFAFATNATGRLSVAIDCTISYPAAVHPGDVLTATAVEESSSHRLAFCDVTVRNQDAAIVGHFRGTVYRTSRRHFPDPDSA
jgi:acyl-CoA thioesterase